MIYQSILPSINRLIYRLSTLTDDHHTYVLNMLFGFFHWLLGSNRRVMVEFLEKNLQAITYIFALCGICVILP
jgi:hypothetical protein